MSHQPFDTVCVIGLGYTGLPTAAFIASSSIRVIGVDVDKQKVEQVNRAELPFYEPGFAAQLREAVEQKNLTAQTITPKANAYIIAVPTPFDDDRRIDMSYILAAADGISTQLEGGELVILESTSPPGTTKKLAEYICEQRSDLTLDPNLPNSIYFAHAPERVLPGSIMKEMTMNDRVIGGLSPRAAELARLLYASFSSGEIHTTDAPTAEMVKLTENTFRDINIAFANELSMICDDLEIDVWELIKLANRHPRVNILQPGPGVGGHCIAVDPWFVISAAPLESVLTRAAREVNLAKPKHVALKALTALRDIQCPRVVCLGLAYKPDIGDLRESPAIEVVAQLAATLTKGIISVVEPHIDSLPDELSVYSNVTLARDTSVMMGADVLIKLVDHQAFQSLTPSLNAGQVVTAAHNRNPNDIP